MYKDIQTPSGEAKGAREANTALPRAQERLALRQKLINQRFPK